MVKVDEEAARRNLELSKGATYSEILLTKLIGKAGVEVLTSKSERLLNPSSQEKHS